MSRSTSKLAALTVLAAVFALFWTVIVTPVANWRAATLSRSLAVSTETERLEVARTRLQTEQAQMSTVESDNGFWTAAQTGEAYARIQGALARSASESGISFRAMTPLPVSRRDGLESAIVRIEFEANLQQLNDFLRAIEYASPALPVERAVLRRLIRPNETSSLPVLFSQIDIAAPLLIAEDS